MPAPSSSLIKLIVNCFFTSLLYPFFVLLAVLSLCGIALKKALSNILSNAVNYTETERHIKVKLEKSVLSIQNECVPLSPDELQHIFEPFYRPNRARDPANGGNGLGLYIVKTILDKQGLQYCFTSMKSKTGMEFVIYF